MILDRSPLDSDRASGTIDITYHATVGTQMVPNDVWHSHTTRRYSPPHPQSGKPETLAF